MYGIPTMRHPLPRLFRLPMLAPLWGAKVALVGRLHSCKLFKSLIFSSFRFSLLHKVKPFGFTPMYVYVGVHLGTLAPIRPLPAPQFLKEIATHTWTPSHAHLRP